MTSHAITNTVFHTAFSNNAVDRRLMEGWNLCTANSEALWVDTDIRPSPFFKMLRRCAGNLAASIERSLSLVLRASMTSIFDRRSRLRPAKWTEARRQPFFAVGDAATSKCGEEIWFAYFLGEAAVRDLEASSVVTRRVRTICLPLDDLGWLCFIRALTLSMERMRSFFLSMTSRSWTSGLKPLSKRVSTAFFLWMCSFLVSGIAFQLLTSCKYASEVCPFRFFQASFTNCSIGVWRVLVEARRCCPGLEDGLRCGFTILSRRCEAGGAVRIRLISSK